MQQLLLAPRYFRRLHLDPTTLDVEPTLAKLRTIQEHHLAYIPFENLSQHGCSKPAMLDIEQTAHKILDCHRGGFCFEVNGLLGAFLKEIGYEVNYTPAFVYAGDSFREDATHVILMVKTKDTPSTYFCDVGFGEPPLHPLEYNTATMLGMEQQTPEGMKSKIVRSHDNHDHDNDDSDIVTLYWLSSDNHEWTPRLKWRYRDSIIGCELSDMHHGLRLCQNPDSIFSQKMIATILTRTIKCTLAGNRLQVTGPPRFSNHPKQQKQEKSIMIRTLESTDEARKVLQDRFGMPWDETEGLTLEKSNRAPSEIWSGM